MGTHRRRRGSTSPPLVGVETNPGPRKKPLKGGRNYVKIEDRHKACRRKKLSQRELGMCYMGFLNNMTNTEIARLVKCSPRTVGFWRERAKASPILGRKVGSGRKKKLQESTVRWLKLQSLRNRKYTAVVLAQDMRARGIAKASSWTVSRQPSTDCP
jgi:hypothetical protein